MKLKEWAAFCLLGTIWGSSFLWIKIAVQEVSPITFAALRLFFGSAGLLVILRMQGQSFPRDPKVLSRYLVLAFFQTALPFALIPWGETKIESSLAAILNATTPLFTILIAHFWLHDEKISLARLLGLIVGFGGVIVLVSRDLTPGAFQSNVWGQAAVLAASASYGVGITFSRRFMRGQPPVVLATMTVLISEILLWIVAPIAEGPIHVPTRLIGWTAILWLGLLGSCTAYLLFFYLINAWGPTRASLVAYVFPVIGLLLGVIILGEAVDWHLGVGSFLIVAGIVIVNLKLKVRAVSVAPASTE